MAMNIFFSPADFLAGEASCQDEALLEVDHQKRLLFFLNCSCLYEKKFWKKVTISVTCFLSFTFFKGCRFRVGGSTKQSVPAMSWPAKPCARTQPNRMSPMKNRYDSSHIFAVDFQTTCLLPQCLDT